MLFSEQEAELGSSPEIGLDLEHPGTSNLEATLGTQVEGDECITIGQVRPSTGYMVNLDVQDLPVEAVVDTGAEVGVLGTDLYHSLQCKPPVKRYVTLMQAGADARRKGFIAGSFAIKAGRSLLNMDLSVAPLKDPMLLGVDFLRGRKAKLD